MEKVDIREAIGDNMDKVWIVCVDGVQIGINRDDSGAGNKTFDDYTSALFVAALITNDSTNNGAS